MPSKKPCTIESEMGSLQYTTYEIVDFHAGKRVFTLSEDYFGRRDPNEKIVSVRLLILICFWACIIPSYRDLMGAINRFRLEKKGIKLTWLKDLVEKSGKEMFAALKEKAGFVLEANGFDEHGQMTPEMAAYYSKTSKEREVDEEKVAARTKEIEEAKARLELDIEIDDVEYDYEDPETTVSTSADDVLTKRQASKRPDSPEKGKRKYVSNTVIHVEKEKKEYMICAPEIGSALAILMGFLAANGLVGMPLYVFYTDGAKNLHDPIETMFAPFRYKIILDWYHLAKKVDQRLSSGMKNYKLRKIFQEQVIMPMLWCGNVSEAIASLKNLPNENIKSNDAITRLIDYLTRNEKYIPCYALRRELGLRNSSNRVEKANDIIVANRQKNRGMSFSYDGSHGLACVTTVWKNDELESWCMDGQLRFSFPPDKKEAA